MWTLWLDSTCNLTCHGGFHVMFYLLPSIEESSVFVARLKSRRFLFLTTEHQHVTFINLLPHLSHWILLWKILPQPKVELAVTKQVWDRWNSSFPNKWEWQECTQPVTAMLQRDGGCVINRNKLLVKWINTSGYGWLFGWVIWWCKLCCALWPGDQERSVRCSYHHVRMLQSFKWQYENGKNAKLNCS